MDRNRLLDRLSGVVIRESELVGDGPFEDWSDVRSPGRARRRRRQGHPQRIRFYYTANGTALQVGPREFVVHPHDALLLRKAFLERERADGG